MQTVWSECARAIKANGEIEMEIWIVSSFEGFFHQLAFALHHQLEGIQ
jgi:hypothetical protein